MYSQTLKGMKLSCSLMILRNAQNSSICIMSKLSENEKYYILRNRNSQGYTMRYFITKQDNYKDVGY